MYEQRMRENCEKIVDGTPINKSSIEHFFEYMGSGPGTVCVDVIGWLIFPAHLLANELTKCDLCSKQSLSITPSIWASIQRWETWHCSNCCFS